MILIKYILGHEPSQTRLSAFRELKHSSYIFWFFEVRASFDELWTFILGWLLSRCYILFFSLSSMHLFLLYLRYFFLLWLLLYDLSWLWLGRNSLGCWHRSFLRLEATLPLLLLHQTSGLEA